MTSILQITTVQELFGQLVLNRWHFVHTDDSTDPSLVLPQFKTSVVDVLMNDSSTSITTTDMLYRIITDPLDPQRSYGVGLPSPGMQGSAAAASFVALTVKWAPGTTVPIGDGTDTRRIRRGGKRIAGLPQGQLVGDNWAAGFVIAMATPFDNYLGMSDGGWLPCIAGFPKPPVPRPTPTDPALQVPNRYALIEGVSIKHAAGSQVSRKEGHGR